jgi:hypothetical protein
LREPERGQISVKKWSQLTRRELTADMTDALRMVWARSVWPFDLPSSPLLFNKKEYINITRYIQSLQQSGVLMIIQMQTSKRERSNRKEKFYSDLFVVAANKTPQKIHLLQK